MQGRARHEGLGDRLGRRRRRRAFHWTTSPRSRPLLHDDFGGEEDGHFRLEIVYDLGAIRTAADLYLQRGIDDDEVLVSQYAASRTQITGIDVSSQVRQENVVRTPTPPRTAIDAALGSLVVLDTTRGTIALRMLPEAPLNATNFVSLAAKAASTTALSPRHPQLRRAG